VPSFHTLPAVIVDRDCLAAQLAWDNHARNHAERGYFETNAKVIIDNQDKGSTPVVADLKREQDHIVRVELAGYEPYETTLTHDVSGWAWGNILAGGLIGLAVDAISGGLYILGPEQVQATLAKHEATSAKLNTDGLYCAAAMDPESAWHQIGAQHRMS
jgi:hypothetical protein